MGHPNKPNRAMEACAVIVLTTCANTIIASMGAAQAIPLMVTMLLCAVVLNMRDEL
ncbi:hypothetical protein KIMH_01100 [Bombiscardovia apis]|uniref:Uncharacterized protein n=1 Tax=Bombiscardovia apis TaxID=2932182 RepID=A0ABN6SD52_9BIFI|nr:hypothetical protein KIMH_01100 [Bombiscardovia apis]